MRFSRPLYLKNEEGHFEEMFMEKQNLSFNADTADMLSLFLYFSWCGNVKLKVKDGHETCLHLTVKRNPPPDTWGIRAWSWPWPSPPDRLLSSWSESFCWETLVCTAGRTQDSWQSSSTTRCISCRSDACSPASRALWRAQSRWHMSDLLWDSSYSCWSPYGADLLLFVSLSLLAPFM